MLQKTVSEKQAYRVVAQEELNKLESSVLTSDNSAAKLAKSDKLLDAYRAKVVSLKEQLERRGTEKAYSVKLVSQVCEKSEQCMVC